MKIDRKTLGSALTLFLKVVPKNAAAPVLRHLVLTPGPGTLQLRGTDLDVSLTALLPTLDTRANLPAPGPELLVNAAELSNVLKGLPKSLQEVEIATRIDDGAFPRPTVLVNGIVLSGDTPEDFPSPVVSAAGDPAFELPGLAASLKKVARAISADTSRYNLCVALVDPEGGVVVGTDGHRMHLADQPATIAGKPIKPGFCAQLAPNVLLTKTTVDVLIGAKVAIPTIRTSETALFVEWPGWSLTQRVVDATFPAYRSVIPAPAKATSILRCSKTAFLEAVKTAMTVSTGRQRPVALAIGTATRYVRGQQDGGDAKAVFPGTLTGAPAIVSVNANYLVDAVASIDDEALTIFIRDEAQPLLFVASGQKIVVMPMRTGYTDPAIVPVKVKDEDKEKEVATAA